MRRRAHARLRNKKHRPPPYRLRVMCEFRRWSRSFDRYFPSAGELAENPRYWNWGASIDPDKYFAYVSAHWRFGEVALERVPSASA
ncbi:hypothetical protein [Lysobacter sp. CA199]|uniref:hypothetical protein n=1 Tax=Lysobacter sp. CA199 TaxID=3455608 RepID=UPI003F8D46D2